MKKVIIKDALDCPYWNGYITRPLCSHHQGPKHCEEREYNFPDNCPLENETTFNEYLEAQI